MSKKLTWSPQEILNATDGVLIAPGDGRFFNGFSIDSRNIDKNCVFVALKGAVHDGHTFLNEVIGKGVRGLIIESRRVPFTQWVKRKDLMIVGVEDTIKALGGLAAYLRRKLPIKVVALTGSNGKTSTRRMTFEVLNTCYNTHATKGNFNNEIGLPLSLLAVEAQHEVAVLELGMNHLGEIDALARICKPDIGMITNVASAHLEGVGSIEGVFKAKSELIPHIQTGGHLILNADDPYVRRMKHASRVPSIFYGINEKAEIFAADISITSDGADFTLVMPSGRMPVHLSIPNRVMIYNALCAAACGFVFELTVESVKLGLERVSTMDGRMSMTKTVNHICVINDTYNANPESSKGAVSAMADMRGAGKLFLVMGDMLELGEAAEQLHEEVGRFAAEKGVDQIYATGNHSDAIAKGAKKGQIASDKIVTGSKSEIFEKLITKLSPHDIVLVKGSRSMKMETIVHDLLAWADSMRR